MEGDDENTLQHKLDLYKAQLTYATQQQTIAGPEHAESLQQLVSDLKEIIALTEGSLLSLKKSKLLQTLETAESSMKSSQPASAAASTDVTCIDAEYAAFQAALCEDLNADSSSTSSNSHPSLQTVAASRKDNSASGEANSGNSNPQPSTSQLSCLPSSCAVKNKLVPSDSDSASTSDTCSDDDEAVGGRKSGFIGDNSLDDELCKLVGMKCCAPFSHDWGKLDYHNAMVMSATRDPDSDQIHVKVIFTTPTHTSMQPCKFYLDGHCKFNDDKCRYSHGQTVPLEELREFVEADHSLIAVDTKCLACYLDDIWYPATVTEVKDGKVSVHFDEYGEDLELDMSQVVPSVLPTQDHSSDSDNEHDQEDHREDHQRTQSTGQGRSSMPDSDDEDGEELPHFLWQPPPKGSDAMGEWENHTRGIGSKLMSKMGYIPGQGLGVRGQGKAEPVPIMLLPQGKSLDRIMQLKELAGNEDLFNAMKKLEKEKRKADKKREEQEGGANSGGGARASSSYCDVFDFINHRLSASKGDHHGGLTETPNEGRSRGPGRTGAGNSGTTPGRRHISEHELHKKTDKDINVQVLKTHEEIRSVQRQMNRLREQLARNENKDRRMAAQVKAKLEEQEAYLYKLQSSSSALENHQKKRNNSKKLAIF